MELIELQVADRSEKGTLAAKRLRRAGIVPGVVYSEGKETTLVQMDLLHYGRTVHGRAQTQLFKFKSENKSLDGKMALVKEIQAEPVKDKILHVDFLAVSADHKISLEIGVELQGVPAPVKSGDSLLNQSAYELEIECFPTQIPEALYLDISGLVEGDSLHASDIKLPEGVRLVSDPEITIVSVIAKREESLEVTPAAEPVVEGQEAVKAEGGEEKEKGDKKE